MIFGTNILKILKEGIASLWVDTNGNRKKLFRSLLGFIILPILLTGWSYWKDIIISDTLIYLSITALGVFTALIFSLIFIAPDKYASRVSRYGSIPSLDVKNYLVRFANFTKAFVARVALIIVISIIMILSLLTVGEVTLNCIKILFSAFCVLLAYYFFLLLFIILSDVYTIMKDDIEIAKEQIKDD